VSTPVTSRPGAEAGPPPPTPRAQNILVASLAKHFNFG